jgi:hypothetical protein
LDRRVLRDPSIRDLVPGARVRRQGAGELVVGPCRGGLEGRGGERGGAAERVWEGLVLLRGGLDWGWGGQVRAFEVEGCEVLHGVLAEGDVDMKSGKGSAVGWWKEEMFQKC